MELGTVILVAQTALVAVQCSEIKELCSILGYESELESLSFTIAVVKDLLLDVEAKEELPDSARFWVRELKNAVFDADDLLDEFVTLAKQKQMLLMNDGNAFKKVCLLLSRLLSLGIAHKMIRRVRKVGKKLDAIADHHRQFGFKIVSCQSFCRRREGTCSYVNPQYIVGREYDVMKIVDILLDHYGHRDVSILTIVGIRGLGKTTLAQIVYDDARIKREFDLRLWICVSEETQSNLKAIVCKILESATNKKYEHLTMDRLGTELRRLLSRNRYLLVLDDVWNEDPIQWINLMELLMGGRRGSWILMTTRSRRTAQVSNSELTYELQGLSQEDLWRLFESIALGHGHGAHYHELVEIGQEIVKRCANNPLAIRVAGSLLQGRDIQHWQCFNEARQGKNDVIQHVLKFSYNHLESPLKVCFTYCALFPQNFSIQKEMLISLWMAQGYLIPLEGGQNMEDIGEQYFLTLLQGFFFQDIDKDQYGEIISCKLHNVMHDIAQEVARPEICIATSITGNLDKRIRHVSDLDASKGFESSFSRTKIRTYLRVGQGTQLPIGNMLENWIFLRVLDLSFLSIRSLSSTIGKLLHLRYLDLSGNNDLEVLPTSITMLTNLQTLKLKWCRRLKELPKDFGKFVNLRLLDTTDCWELTHMPSGLEKLSYLRNLSMFVVGETNSREEQKQCFVDQLEELKVLTNLRGHLEISVKISKNGTYVRENGRGGYLRNKKYLNHLTIRFSSEDGESERIAEYEKELLEDLQPHPSLKTLLLVGYNGTRMPNWAREDNFPTYLPHLVSFRFESCCGLQAC